MIHDESAIDEMAGRLQDVDASLTSSIAEISAVALQELIEAEVGIPKLRSAEGGACVLDDASHLTP